MKTFNSSVNTQLVFFHISLKEKSLCTGHPADQKTGAGKVQEQLKKKKKLIKSAEWCMSRNQKADFNSVLQWFFCCRRKSSSVFELNLRKENIQWCRCKCLKWKTLTYWYKCFISLDPVCLKHGVIICCLNWGSQCFQLFICRLSH